MHVTFGTPENYRTEFLRFEVASFDCGYNAIIVRPGLAKFMAILHYSYMILKMPGPQGIITVCADFQGAAECFRGAIQATLITKPPMTSSTHANTKPEEDLAVPANEAQAMTSMRPAEETKRINLGSLMNARLSSSALALTKNRKVCSSSSCKITETYSHGNLWICRES
jgi:hypothetical protein